ncbi:type II toxin-antitoxin system PemK/MazF family toxin [Defluviimonas salinarum]|uniref:Type II toxin-antitoxin system PemK/MazF family toxin n=1 Tax=Defluviimonas salinarum TaxID=2992147 RepID=A0ABT3J4W1_9RHOB|nr:type II toxin-antitoxin system PemK/MazF family toxin [Defluviimonas salinarum]MCW3782500.1 type II toxin-antitoxin system PemK/MazF family toxin [Defluviimonas salinarum]
MQNFVEKNELTYGFPHFIFSHIAGLLFRICLPEACCAMTTLTDKSRRSDHSGPDYDRPAPRRAPGLKDRMDLQPGDLIIYPFLWSWESEKGIVHASKMRPCVVLLRIDNPDGPSVVILPITTKPAAQWHDRFHVPEDECRRVGMDPSRNASIGLNDYNFEVVATSSCLRHNVPVRAFSAGFVEGLATRFLEVLAERRAFQVVRTPIPAEDDDCMAHMM